MNRIEKVSKMTDNRFVNLYHVKGKNRLDGEVNYYVASRRTACEKLKLATRDNQPDGVVIYSLYGEKDDQVVLVRQYRYAINDYIYEFPAGLVEPGEDFRSAAIREMKEETGLILTPVKVPEGYEKPCFTTIGMTDESCATVFGRASGQISTAGLEASEDLEVVIADRKEVKRILKEEKVAIMCAYMLMHFVSDEHPFDFLK